MNDQTEPKNEGFEIHLDITETQVPTPPGEPTLTTAGGWCAPTDTLYDFLPSVSVARGGLTFPDPVQIRLAAQRRAEHRHKHRWKRRRTRVKSWLLLRPLRNKIHDHVHRNCEDW